MRRLRRAQRAGRYDDATHHDLRWPGHATRDIRDNARLLLDDPALAERLWERAQPLIPRNINDWKALGLNERFRFYRYDVGQKFAPHFDGYFSRGDNERSQLTFMVYLNADFTGGETRFYGEDRQVRMAVASGDRHGVGIRPSAIA